MATAGTKTNDNLTAILFAVFAVASIGAFLTYRGSDIGQMSRLVENLGGGPLFGKGVVDSLVGLVAALLIGLSWFGLGSAIARLVRLPETNDGAKTLAIIRDTAIGAAVWSIVWFFIGYASAYRPVLAIVSLFLGIGFAASAWRRLLRTRVTDFPKEKRPSFASYLIFFCGGVLLITLIASLAPPIAKDTLLYHFAVPKAFVSQHTNAFIDGNIASYLAMGTEMHYVWGMLVGGLFSQRAAEAAAGALGFLFFPLLLATIYAWARELDISRTWALLATAAVASVPTAFYVASSGYIDLALAWFVMLAVYSLSRWWKAQTWNWALLIAIFLGAALSIKLTAVFVIAAFALVILVRARSAENAGKVIGIGFAALVLGGIAASPWYIRTWRATGSPVFPFYMSIWPGKANGWDVERSNLFQAMNSQYGGVDESKLNIVTAPARASILAQPEQPKYYDGVLGVAFLIGLPVFFWALWKYDLAVEVKIAAGVAGIMYLFWLFSSEQLRYLLPILPLLAIAIAASAGAVTKTRPMLGRVLQYSLVATCLCGIATSFAWFCQKAPLRVVLGGETRDEYLTRNLDHYPYYTTINRNTPADSRVWLINMRRDTYHVERPVFSDYLFEDWTLRKLVWGSRSVDELRAKAAAMNVQYVLARHDFLFDYNRSTLVDENAPTAVNTSKLNIAREFLLDPQRTIKADNKFSLVKVF